MGGSTSIPESESEGDKDDPDNQQLKYDGNWQTIQDKPRRCTDIIFLLLIISSWIAMTVVGFGVAGVYHTTVLRKGNVNRLLYSSDYQGRICGIGSGVTDKKYGYYLADGSVVCVSSCPSSTDYDAGICQDNYQSEADSSEYALTTYIQEYKCLFDIKSIAVLNRCIPTESLSTIENALQSQYNVTSSYSIPSSGTWFKTFCSDIYNLRGIIFGIGLGVSTSLAFLYLFILRIPGFLEIVLWGIILSIQICLLLVSFLLYHLASVWKNDGNHSNYEVNGIQILAFIGMGICVLYFCLMIVLRKRIFLAIGLVKETVRVLETIPILNFMPIMQVIGTTIFLVPWIIYVLCLATSGEESTVTKTYTETVGGISSSVSYQYKTFTFAQNTKYAFLYMIFCYFWTAEFILAIGQLTLALSISSWYFCRNKKSIGNHTALWAFQKTLFCHAGTAAFGSLIIAIIQTIRTVLTYYQNQAKKIKQKGPIGYIIKYVGCCIQCCLWYLEKFMKFINKNAYIQTAIFGYSFFKAAKSAFYLILRNILRVAAVNMVADFLLFMGKIFVVASTVLIGYLVLAYAVNIRDINGIVSPLIFIGILSYSISSMFSEVFSMSIETMLCCYIADEEMFPPADRYAEGPLRTTLQKTAQAAAAKKVGATAHHVSDVMNHNINNKKDNNYNHELFFKFDPITDTDDIPPNLNNNNDNNNDNNNHRHRHEEVFHEQFHVQGNAETRIL